MAQWREEYLAALAVRDQREKANSALYDAYSRLADRTAQLTTPLDSSAGPGQLRPSGHEARTASPPVATSKKQPTEGSSATDLLITTRADLSEAQRSRSELQGRLDRVNTEYEKLRKKNAQDSRRLNALDHERTNLQLRLKDRDEELRQKAKLLEDFQDEIATLNLQLNMADEKSSKLQRENKELVDRWMARMGQEADAMNDASKFS
ncbi:Autophagy-related protein 16 [Penicillium cinerascens]|uniref:Autophagy-related protein 16 n=1 Tax=Penicillium cinerascens TaxID=70096 RepID=A0A9W9NHP5_9EURO|nr:Autophagy-related protein 16 [Penicillium cinerascens]KAJ5218828.1 Autophagy-related protein 16 [Penicillium cinerascens]